MNLDKVWKKKKKKGGLQGNIQVEWEVFIFIFIFLDNFVLKI